MVQQGWIAWSILGFGAHTLLGAAGSVLTKVLQEFVTIDTLELTTWKLTVTLETLAEGTGQWVTLHTPELGHTNASWVALQCSTH